MALKDSVLGIPYFLTQNSLMATLLKTAKTVVRGWVWR